MAVIAYFVIFLLLSMTFTDDDLKRLKDLKGDWRGISMPNEAIAALLMRLEAAEDAVEQAYRCTPDNREYYKRWRKSKGEK